MAISKVLARYLNSQTVPYEVIAHRHTNRSKESAVSADLPGEQFAKAVIVNDEGRYLMVVVQALEQVDFAAMHHFLGHPVELAEEQELKQLFPDCAVGAIPAIGAAWKLDVFLDTDMLLQDPVYIEAGDHEHIIRLSGADFQRLLEHAEHGHFAHTL